MRYWGLVLLMCVLAISLVMTGCVTDSGSDDGDAAMHVVNGTVTDSQGNGVANITVTLTSDAVSRTATTGTDGRYSFADVPGGVYVVTAVLGGSVIDPLFRQITVQNSDVTVAVFVAGPNSSSLTRSERLTSLYLAHVETKRSITAKYYDNLIAACTAYQVANDAASQVLIGTTRSLVESWYEGGLSKALRSTETGQNKSSGLKENPGGLLNPDDFQDAVDDYMVKESENGTQLASELEELHTDYNEQQSQESDSFVEDVKNAMESDGTSGDNPLVTEVEAILNEAQSGDGGGDIAGAIEDVFDENLTTEPDSKQDVVDAVNDMLTQGNDQEVPLDQGEMIDGIMDEINDLLINNQDMQDLVEDILDASKDYRDGLLNPEDLRDRLNDMLENGDNGEPQTVYTLDIFYYELLEIVAQGLNSRIESETEGLVTFASVLSGSETVFEGQGQLTYLSTTNDNITGTKGVESGTVDVKISGTFSLGPLGEECLDLSLTYTYNTTATFTYPEIGDISVPGEKESWTDQVILHKKDGYVEEKDEQIGGMHTIRSFTLHIDK